MGILALVIIIVIAVLIAYLVVRRSSALNNTIDTLSMLPYIMPGAVIGLALLIAFGKNALCPHRYHDHHDHRPGHPASALHHPFSNGHADADLHEYRGSSHQPRRLKAKTFVKITVPMMANGIFSGAILSWVAIVTELSSSIILYNQKSITLTMSTYVAISRGNYGLAAAFAAILTLITTISLLIYLAVTKSEDVRL